MHIPLVLIFDETITTWFARFFIVNHLDLLNWSVRLELTPEFRLARVEVDPADEQGLERVGRDLLRGGGVPQCDFLFEFVSDLFLFFSFFAFQSKIN